jgi:NADH-quinone oxidoreductase subunit H
VSPALTSFAASLVASPVLAGLFGWLSLHPDHGGSTAGWVVGRMVLIFVIINVTLVMAALLVWAERRVSAWMQDRLGPNRVGPQGLLQPLADLGKFIFKEDFDPGHVNRSMYLIAPLIAMVPALITFAVIPYTGQVAEASGAAPASWVSWAVADVNIGILYILAITSLAVYGLALGGWASNSKYSLLGGVRSSAQMISYELSLGLAVVSIVLVSSSLHLGDIVAYQARHTWFAFQQPVAFFIFLVSAYAETNRLPFDLPEAESELVAGYHTEYSAMKFAAFFLAEYVNMFVGSALVVTLFCGGWTLFGLEQLGWWMGLLIFAAKTLFFCFVFIWVRWTLPRFRYDQLMRLGWSWFIPVALANVILTAAALALDLPWVPWILPAVLALGGLLAAWIAPGHVVVPRLEEHAATAAGEEGGR